MSPIWMANWSHQKTYCKAFSSFNGSTSGDEGLHWAPLCCRIRWRESFPDIFPEKISTIFEPRACTFGPLDFNNVGTWNMDWWFVSLALLAGGSVSFLRSFFVLTQMLHVYHVCPWHIYLQLFKKASWAFYGANVGGNLPCLFYIYNMYIYI